MPPKRKSVPGKKDGPISSTGPSPYKKPKPSKQAPNPDPFRAQAGVVRIVGDEAGDEPGDLTQTQVYKDNDAPHSTLGRQSQSVMDSHEHVTIGQPSYTGVKVRYRYYEPWMFEWAVYYDPYPANVPDSQR